MSDAPVSARTVTPNRSPVYRVIKRTIDIAASLAGLIVLSPLLGIVALLIYIDDPGPVIFAQARSGLNNRTFTMYKFRSMVKNAAEIHKDMQPLNELDGPVFKIKNDPRVTRVGHFIRKTSIDELPQLFNVLIGNMSLVGPRPLPVYESEQCSAYQLQRLLVKPGITCFWQISGRNDISFDEWIEMDLEYIRTASVRTDFSILLHTVTAVLGGKGAY